MKIALLCSNLFNIDKENKTGTGIFNYVFINGLAKYKTRINQFTVFASEKSNLPLKVEGIDFHPSSADKKIIKYGKHIMFELALIAKAFQRQNKFDIYHVNIGDGDLTLPFAGFVKKPILITLHHIINADFTRKYFSYFKNKKNIFFVSTSNYQRKILPKLNYIDTIHHGVETEKFSFNPKGGNSIMWAGRLIPEKGPQVVIKLAKNVGNPAKLFGVIKDGYEDWYKKNICNQIITKKDKSLISLHLNFERSRLIRHFQNSKLFILPTNLEEAFGLVYIEAMACGTPVVTYARGAAPEVIKDGETGFLVNSSEQDIRGNWLVKKTGVAGLQEAAERILSMSNDEYKKMRKLCRQHVVDNFSVEKMVNKYLNLYKKMNKINF